MPIESSGRFMVRVPRVSAKAMTAAAQFIPGPGMTRPLFMARPAPKTAAAARMASAAPEWLLHEPASTDLHPWDAAHRVARGQLDGSKQFARAKAVYVEPDISYARPRPPPQRLGRARLAARAAAPSGPPWPPTEMLNTHYDPKSGVVFSPGWHLDADHANFAGAWKFNTGEGVRIAHLDTGYTPSHMSTPRNVLRAQGRNFHGDTNNTTDPYISGVAEMPGHGTATLALLAGKAVSIVFNNGPVYNGDIGGAPDASIVPVRIGASVIHVYSADMAQGLNYALAPNGGGQCDVVSLSHGGLPSQAWADAVNDLYNAGVVVVAASGDSISLKIMDVATHFTVYPAAFYRVITATGATYSKGPYITSAFNVMQGCWGPDKVMHKAIAAYTPNVPWMIGKDEPHRWDMDGGGTSASTPQIAAACALWLKEYGGKFPAGWKRIEACRHALFESARNRGKNLEEIGIGILDAGEMLSDATYRKVKAAYDQNKLPNVPPDSVSFPFWRLLFGIAPPGDGVDEMYETEAAQIFFRSANKMLAAAVEANPEGDLRKAPKPADAKALRDAFINEPSMSNTLRAYLKKQTTAFAPPAAPRTAKRRATRAAAAPDGVPGTLDGALAVVAPHVDRARWLQSLTAAFAKFGINTNRRMAVAVGQFLVEAGEKFQEVVENLNYTHAGRIVEIFPDEVPNLKAAEAYVRNPKKLANHVYANRNGNGDEASGDGYRFRGRGLIQLTGRGEYTEFGGTIGESAENAAVYCETPEGAAMSAGWYLSSRGCLPLADAWEISKVTRRVNGAKMVGNAKRIAYAKAMLEQLGG